MLELLLELDDEFELELLLELLLEFEDELLLEFDDELPAVMNEPGTGIALRASAAASAE